MGVLYWAAKEDGKHKGKRGVSCWVQKRQPFEKEGTEQKMVVGYRGEMSCRRQGKHVL